MRPGMEPGQPLIQRSKESISRANIYGVMAWNTPLLYPLPVEVCCSLAGPPGIALAGWREAAAA